MLEAINREVYRYAKVNPGPMGVLAVQTMISYVTMSLAGDSANKEGIALSDIAEVLSREGRADVAGLGITASNLPHYINKEPGGSFDGAKWVVLREAVISNLPVVVNHYVCNVSGEYARLLKKDKHEAELHYDRRYKEVYADFEEALSTESVRTLKKGATEPIATPVRIEKEPEEQELITFVSKDGRELQGYLSDDGEFTQVVKEADPIEELFWNKLFPILTEANVPLEQLRDYLLGQSVPGDES